MEESQIAVLWSELKALVAAAEKDTLKCAKGNAAAGRRSRRNLRLMRAKALELVRLTIYRAKLEKRYRFRGRNGRIHTE